MPSATAVTDTTARVLHPRFGSPARSTATATALRIAAFDVDGTLIGQELVGPLPRMLLDAGLVERDRWVRLHDHLSTLPPHGHDDAALLQRTYALYADMVRGVSCDAVDGVLRRLWAGQRDRLFGFARPLLADLRDAGFTPMLISNGMHELLALAASDLGIELFNGTRLTTSRGVYTGEVPASAGVAKHLAAATLAAGRPIRWAQSLAVGDGLPDAELLQRVGHPFAIEPSPALARRARIGRWPIASRDTLSALVRSSLGVEDLALAA